MNDKLSKKNTAILVLEGLRNIPGSSKVFLLNTRFGLIAHIEVNPARRYYIAIERRPENEKVRNETL